jgi:hypothetical protein
MCVIQGACILCIRICLKSGCDMASASEGRKTLYSACAGSSRLAGTLLPPPGGRVDLARRGWGRANETAIGEEEWHQETSSFRQGRRRSSHERRPPCAASSRSCSSLALGTWDLQGPGGGAKAKPVEEQGRCPYSAAPRFQPAAFWGEGLGWSAPSRPGTAARARGERGWEGTGWG